MFGHNMKIGPFLLVVLVIGVVVLALIRKKGKADQNRSGDDWPPEIVKKVNADRAAREKVKQQFPDLFTSVAAAMFRHDPIGINYKTNTDEYDAEAGTVIPRLNKCSSVEDVTNALHEEFIRWFGSDTAGDRARYVSLASEIWTLWNKAKTESGRRGS